MHTSYQVDVIGNTRYAAQTGTLILTVFPLPSSDFTGIGASYIILHHLVMENGEKGILSRNLVSNEKAYVSI